MVVSYYFIYYLYFSHIKKRISIHIGFHFWHAYCWFYFCFCFLLFCVLLFFFFFFFSFLLFILLVLFFFFNTFTLTAVLILLFLMWENYQQWRQHPYIFMRFLLQRMKMSEIEILFVDHSYTLMDVFSLFKRTREH